MSKERYDLECIQTVVDYWFQKTGDKFYAKLSKRIGKKLNESDADGH